MLPPLEVDSRVVDLVRDLAFWIVGDVCSNVGVSNQFYVNKS